MQEQNLQKAQEKITPSEEKASILSNEDIEILKTEVNELKEIKQFLIKREESFSGPLPHPDHFSRYNKILPGSGNRLLKMVEEDLSHQQFVQKLYGFIDGIASISGIIIGGVVALTALIGSGYLILKGHDAAGAFLGTGSLASLVGVFIYGTRHKK